MKAALIADIHSNLHALEVALDIARKHDVDIVACAGDIVGYGAFPNECCAMIKDECDHAILGNHDRAVLSKDVSRMNPYAAAAAFWTASELSDESRIYLQGLSESIMFELSEECASMFHGSPDDPDEYVYEEMLTEDLIRKAGCRYLVLGHTHIPYVQTLGDGTAMNPGSVGQPRDRNPQGSLVLLETEQVGKAEIIRFDYPIDEAAEAIISRGLPRILAERLHVGW